jgi:hypothetical protein
VISEAGPTQGVLLFLLLPHQQASLGRTENKLSACRGEGSVVGLQLRVRFVPAALLAMLMFLGKPERFPKPISK